MSFPELSQNHREKILRHNWWGHDGRWYMLVAKELGFQKANEINMEINKAVGKLEMRNLMAISGMNQKTIHENFLQILRMNLELCAKDVFGIKEFMQEGSNFILRIVSCPAQSGTRKAGYAEHYQCACFKRAEGWFEAIGVKSTSSITKSLVNGDQCCEIVVHSER